MRWVCSSFLVVFFGAGIITMVVTEPWAFLLMACMVSAIVGLIWSQT